MAYNNLLILFVLSISKVAIAQDCSILELKGSGLPDFHQATKVPYCIIDECTIARCDRGQQLAMDIIYTTDSVIVVTPKGNQTAMVIVRTFDNIHCTIESDVRFRFFVAVTVVKLIQGTVSACIIILHLVFKDMQTAAGLLMVLYNGAVIFQSLSGFALLYTSLIAPTNSQQTCYTIQFVFMQGLILPEAFATCMLAHIVCIMYYSDKLRAIIPTVKLFKRYTIYIASILGLFTFFIVMYDVATGNSQNVIMHGYCAPLNTIYSTTDIAGACVALNKAIQIMLFATFLVYLYKHKKSSTTEEVAVKRQNKMFIKIIIMMGSLIGIGQFLWLMVTFLQLYHINVIAANIFLIVQQCITLAIISYKKMVEFCTKE